MDRHKEIINEVTSGNGNQFGVKEILTSHIRDNKEEHKKIFDRLEKGNEKFATKSFVWKLVGLGTTSVLIVIGLLNLIL